MVVVGLRQIENCRPLLLKMSEKCTRNSLKR